MSQSKRYTLINNHIGRGSLLSQSNHALNELWRNFYEKKFTEEGNKLMLNWLENPIEVVVEGGVHKQLEEFYKELQDFQGLAIGKFNESMDDLQGACTAVTFIATDRIVAMNNYLRFNNIPHPEKLSHLKTLSATDLNFQDNVAPTDAEMRIAAYIATLEKI